VNTDDQKEMLRLVELEYERTTKFIEGSVGLTTSIRGWAITVWAALIGVAFSQRVWELPFLAVIAIAAFAVVDAYYSSLYKQALLRARALERVTGKHYDALARGKDNPRAMAAAAASLAANSYGFYTNLRALRPRDLVSKAPRVFLAVYSVLAVAAIVSAPLVATLPSSASSSTSTASSSPTPGVSVRP
jgi:hypothetical protein